MSDVRGGSGSDWARLFVRLALAALFLYTGVRNAAGFGAMAERIASAGYPAAGAMAAIACAAQILGGLSLGLGAATRAGGLAVILFLVPTTLSFHLLPALAGDPMQAIQALKNLVILAAAAMITSEGPGAFSVDRAPRRRRR